MVICILHKVKGSVLQELESSTCQTPKTAKIVKQVASDTSSVLWRQHCTEVRANNKSYCQTIWNIGEALREAPHMHRPLNIIKLSVDVASMYSC